MKNKNTTAFLALISGFAGTHHFYLGNTLYGMGYIVLMIWKFKLAWLIAIIEGIRLLTMSNEEFNRKYLNDYRYFKQKWNDSSGNIGKDKKYDEKYDEKYQEKYDEKKAYVEEIQVKKTETSSWNIRTDHHKLREEGIKKYKEYDLQGAIVLFEKVIETSPSDAPTLFNLACCYSMIEEKNEAFDYLSRAVKAGMKDFDKIMKHDGLAYLRIQSEWSNFVENDYQNV